MIEFLKPQQIQTLEALAQYQYLTAKQLHDYEISKSLPVIRNKILVPLTSGRQPFANYQGFAGKPGKGALSRIYYLTRRGAEAVAERQQIDSQEIHYPKGGVQFTDDYFHRVNFIDIHIALRKWALLHDYSVEFFTSYFDMIGSNRTGKTPMSSKNRFMLNNKIFIPDGITRIQQGDKLKLFAIEMHRGNNTKRIVAQLNRNIDAMAQGIFNQRYDHPTANFLLSVYEKPSILEAVRNRMLAVKDFEAFERLILFSTLDQVKADFSSHWIYANGESVEHLKPK